MAQGDVSESQNITSTEAARQKRNRKGEVRSVERRMKTEQTTEAAQTTATC